MFRSVFESKCMGLSSHCALKQLLSTFQLNFNLYHPNVRDSKARNKSKPRKVNLSNELRKEFAKFKGKTPIIKCKRMEFNFFEGMKYAKFQPIPLASLAWNNRGSNGDYFTLYENYMAPNDLHFGHVAPPKSQPHDFIVPENESSSEFLALGIEGHFVEILTGMGVTRPADIQIATIPHILQRKCSIVSAHTGCGKTLAYLLPVVQMVLDATQRERTKIAHDSPRALILTPSRELAYQIYDVLQKLVAASSLSTKLLVGGYEDRIGVGNPNLPEVVDIVVGSLGTVQKSIKQGKISMERLHHLVFDEADQLVDDQNRPILKSILKQVPILHEPEEDEHHLSQEIQGAQVILVSATMPVNLTDLFQNSLNVGSLKRISTSHLHDVLKNVPQLFLRVAKTSKGKTLIDLVEKDHKHRRPTIIFSNKVETADWVNYQLNECGFTCKNLTSSVETSIRQHLFQRFQRGEFNILSTTPMAARGLDTVRVKHIINFEFPLYISEYLHQIGRVGRIGSSKSCHITNIVSHPREVELVQKIELSVRKSEKLKAANANIQGILSNRSERADRAIF